MKVYLIVSLVTSLLCNTFYIQETMQVQLSSKLNSLANNINELTKLAYYDSIKENKSNPSSKGNNSNINERISFIEKNKIPLVQKAFNETVLSLHIKDIQENNIFYNSTYIKHEYSIDYFNNTLNSLSQKINSTLNSEELKAENIESHMIETNDLETESNILADIESIFTQNEIYSEISLNSIHSFIAFTKRLTNSCGSDLSKCNIANRETLTKSNELLHNLQKDIKALEYNFKEISD